MSSVLVLAAAATLSGAGDLRLAATIPLPKVDGRIDHLAIDVAGRRLFVAALGNNTVEIIDLTRRQVSGHITGLHHPQGLGYVPSKNTLVVANADDPAVRFYDASTLKVLHDVRLGDDCDNVRVDEAGGRVYVGYGDGAIAALDLDGKKIGEVAVGGHPESFQLEPNGPRLYVNVPDRGEVVVIDRMKSTVIAHWKITAAANFPMAIDAARHRVFIGCRRPARLLALDSGTGAAAGVADIVGDTDDLFYDAPTGSVYAIGGGGAITAVDVVSGVRAAGETETAGGARTGLLVADLRQLIVAAPRRGTHDAELRIYDLPR